MFSQKRLFTVNKQIIKIFILYTLKSYFLIRVIRVKKFVFPQRIAFKNEIREINKTNGPE